MECPFQVGDRVVCVRTVKQSAFATQLKWTGFTVGNVYTIRTITPFSGGRCSDGNVYPPTICLKFQGKADRLGGGPDYGYCHSFFRPIKPLSFWIGEKQDIKLDDLVRV